MVQTRSQHPESADVERSAMTRGSDPDTPVAVGVSAAALGGAPPPVTRADPKVTTTIPGAVPVVDMGALPPAQRIPPPVADVLPPPPPLPTDIGQMLTFLQQMLETQRAQAEAQQRQADAMRQGMEDVHQLALAAVEQRAPHHGTRTRYGDIQDFKKLGPRDFSGIEGVVYVDDWLEDIERQMRASRLADDLKVEAVGLQLLDIARTWFRNEPALAGEGHTWAEFKLLFKKKFFSPTDKIDLVRQFQDLQQGSLSVEEYAAEFGRLSRYAEYMVRDPEIRASRFREGLTWDIKILIPSFYETYTQIYAEARKVEREWGLKPKRERDLFSGATSSAGAAKRPQLQHRSFQHHQPQVQVRAPVQQVQHTQQRQAQHGAPCNFCKKPGHIWEVCRKRLGVCLYCGEAGHQLRDCPTSHRRVARGAVAAQGALARVPAVQPRGPLPTQQQRFAQHHQPRGVQDRAFALAAEEIEPVADVVADADEEDYSTYYGPDDVVGLDLETLVQQGLVPPDEPLA
ncbi:uncharacterized protein M6B38_353025 [Iris pallida]|uniref:CCHC-type domain-containing protein n=1 Tax=Iris pallida TaxID=29817 RepID=A0AAX6GQK2_IRIPA|nr:uncharacterized protein M6B38_353025 [Iris pallida]